MKKLHEISLRAFYVDKQLEGGAPFAAVETPVSPIEFIIGENYLGIDLFPFQRAVVKTVFGLWPSMPPDGQERLFLENMRSKWGITIEQESSRGVEQLVLVAGRRSGKTLVAAAMIAYGAYSLICKGNPQAFYGINQDQAIRFFIVACKQNQAQDIFEHTSRIIRGSSFFQRYLDPERNTKDELGLFTPYELSRAGSGSGTQQVRGSIVVESVPTVGSTNRGRSIYYLVLSEFAHMQRSGADEAQQTDSALYKALAPSIKDFRGDGKIFMESSPREEGGEFYDNYRLGGGGSRDSAAPVPRLRGHQAIQASTWEANPSISEESLDDEFIKDAASAKMEYGAQFGLPSHAFFSLGQITQIIDPALPSLRTNIDGHKFFIALDMGGKSATEDADAAVVVWGHREGSKKWVDGLQTFRPQQKDEQDRPWEAVQPFEIFGFISSLVGDLSGSRYIVEVSFDQYESMMVGAHLKRMGLNPFEVVFTNDTKRDICETLFEQIKIGNVAIRGGDAGGSVRDLCLEFEVFQREVRGDRVFYHHPHIGPLQHDDHVVAVALLIYRMSRQEYLARGEWFAEKPAGGGPRILSTGGPVKGPPLYGRRVTQIPAKLQGRLQRR